MRRRSKTLQSTPFTETPQANYVSNILLVLLYENNWLSLTLFNCYV